MALTAGDLIDEAKARTASSAVQQEPRDAPLLKALSSKDEELVQFVARNAPDLLSTASGKAQIVDNANTQGYLLNDGVHYQNFVYHDSDDETTDITMVMRMDQDHPPRHPAAVLVSEGPKGKMFPVDPMGERWAGSEARTWWDGSSGDKFSYSYVPPGGGLTKLSDELGSPDLLKPLLVKTLQLDIVLDQPRVDGDRAQVYMQEMQRLRRDLIITLSKFATPKNTSGRRSRRLDPDIRELLN